MIFTPFALPSIASAIVILFLLIYIVLYRRNNDRAWLVITLMICFFIWSFCYAMMLTHTALDQKVFWFNLSQFGPDFSPILWAFMALEHTGHSNWFHKKWPFIAFIFPLTTTLLMWTNDWHHLLRRSVSLISIGSHTTTLAIERGPWFIIETVYGYFFILLSLYLLIRFQEMSSSKKQTITLIGSMMVPIFFNLLDVFQINPLKYYGASSIAFSITGVFLAWGLYRQRFLDIAPIARNIVLEKIGDGVIVLDRQHRIVDANPAAYTLFRNQHISPSKVIGTVMQDLISFWPEWNGPFELANDDRNQIELKVNGEQRYFIVTSSLITQQRQRPVGWVIIFNDITEEKRTNQRLEYQLDEIKRLHEQLREQAIRDALTGCYNRHFMNEMLVRETSRANREKDVIGLMMLDVDHFKMINDTYGHGSGDQVLQDIGHHLLHWVRKEDTVYRYGGEEFLAVLPGISLEAIHARAKSLCSQIAELQFVVAPGVMIHVTVSIGVALYPVHKDDLQQALKCADQALYSAKNAGRNTVSVWDANMAGLA